MSTVQVTQVTQTVRVAETGTSVVVTPVTHTVNVHAAGTNATQIQSQAVSSTAATSGQALVHNGTQYAPRTIPLFDANGSWTGVQTAPVIRKSGGGGVADMGAFGSVQEAFDTCTAEGIWLDMGGGEFDFTSQHTAGSNLKIMNGSLNMIGAGAIAGLVSTGGSIGSDIAITSEVVSGAISFDVADASSLSAGSTIMLQSGVQWGVNPGARVSEKKRIKSISGNTVTLYHSVKYNYALANSPVVKLVTYVTGWRMRDITFIGDTSVVQSAMRPDYLKDAVLESIRGTGFRSRVMGFRTGWNVEVRGPTFENGDPDFNGTTNYGLAWESGCHWCRMIGGSGENLRHVVTIGGDSYINRHIMTMGAQSIGATNSGFDSHEDADHVSFVNVEIHRRTAATGPLEGVGAHCAGLYTQGVRVYGDGDAAIGVQWNPTVAADVPVQASINNTIGHGKCVSLVKVLTGGTQKISSLMIDGTQYADRVGKVTTLVDVDVATCDVDNLNITRTSGDGCTSRGIFVHASSGRSITGGAVEVGNFKMEGGASECVRVAAATADSISGLKIGGFSFDGGTFGVQTVNTDHIQLGINKYRNQTTAPFRIVGTNSRVTQLQQTSADVGNASKTLTVGISEITQVWNTALTANRTVTLSTTGAVNGARFRITRTANATGAFNLNVGTGPLKALAAGTWCEVEYDGSAWFLSQYGAL